MSTVAMSDACRVGLHFGTRRLDFVLPAEISVAAVIPSIVDHIAVDDTATTPEGWHDIPTDWQLSRIDGSRVLPQVSLRDNGIRDGDVLWLRPKGAGIAPSPADDVIARMATALDAKPRWTSTAGLVAASIILLICMGLVGCALLRSQSHHGGQAAALISGLLSASAMLAAAVCGRAHRNTVPAVTLGSCAIGYAAVTGYLAVPGDNEAPKLMLAAAMGATVAVLTARYIRSGTIIFSAASAFGYLTAAAACAHLFLVVHIDATGAMLGTAAVATLAQAASVAIWVGGLRVPQLPESASHAGRAHAIASGLVCGCSAAAAVGAGMAAFAGKASGVVFAAAVALILALRANTHVDLVQSAALIAGGTACFAVVFLWAVDAWPQHAHWTSLAAATVAAGAAVVVAARHPATASPLWRRCVELMEYAVLAALVPTACWACGVFAYARGLG